MQYTSAVTIESRHVDALGHLNHVSALELLEYARDGWYAAANLWEGRDWSGAETLQTLVLNVNFNYRLECFQDEAITIVTAPVSRGNKSFIVSQEIIKLDGRVAIDGSATSLVRDAARGETIPVPGCLARYLPPRG